MSTRNKVKDIIVPVILSGGLGTRLWPLSRKEYPKQYLSLVGDNTMLQETILRLNGLDSLAEPIIVCNADHRFLVAEQCQQIGIKNPTILLEPIGRNTAPAIAAAALELIKQTDDAVMLVLSADHVIQDVKAFHKAINVAGNQAQDGKLATFGIVPTDANTGYGYIQAKPVNDECLVMNVEFFHEKPDQKTAEKYLAVNSKLNSENSPLEFLWNSGMFMFQASSFIEELTAHATDIVNSVNNAINNATQDLDFIRLEKKAFESSPSNSIDYVLMEKSNNVVVVPLDAQWNDIGTWSALYDIGVKDDNGNVIKGDVFTQETTNTYINASHHMVATIGIQDLVIVDTPNATLVSTKDKAQEVVKIVERLQQQDRVEQFCHRKVYRPWGWYDSIEKEEKFQVKRIHVNPGAKLSLQSHKHRAEHWVVVKGKAIVTRGNDVFNLEVNQSTHIPIGELHSLENYSKLDSLDLVEVQSGTYFGEDDIIRYDDIYNRI